MPDQTPVHIPTPQEIRARVRAISIKSLDVIERIVDQLRTEPAAPPALPLAAARRQMVNLFGVPRLCHRSRCRRTGLCAGEPSHCLSECLPALPHELIARVLSRKAIRQRTRRARPHGEERSAGARLEA